MIFEVKVQSNFRNFIWQLSSAVMVNILKLLFFSFWNIIAFDMRKKGKFSGSSIAWLFLLVIENPSNWLFRQKSGFVLVLIEIL